MAHGVFDVFKRKLEEQYESSLSEDPGPPSHNYLSTACLHGQHEQCRHECKFCQAPCRCACHDQLTEPNTDQEG